MRLFRANVQTLGFYSARYGKFSTIYKASFKWFYFECSKAALLQLEKSYEPLWMPEVIQTLNNFISTDYNAKTGLQ